MSRKTLPFLPAQLQPPDPVHITETERDQLVELLRFERPLALICKGCGSQGFYRVGQVVIDPQAKNPETLEHVGFTGYFRCKKCGAGGPWDLPTQSVMRVTAFVFLAMAALESEGHLDELPLRIGKSATFDRFTFRYATEGEAHLKELIEKEPRRPFLWVRLGNLYAFGGAVQLAEEAYRKALELDDQDAEAHYNLARLFFDEDRGLEAVPHWHFFLSHARNAQGLSREQRWNMVRAALNCLLETHHENPGQFQLMPTVDHAELQSRLKEVRFVNLDLSTEEDFSALCAMFADPPRQSRREMFDRGSSRRSRNAYKQVAPAVRTLTVPRNALCPCGSKKKYKKCCGA